MRFDICLTFNLNCKKVNGISNEAMLLCVGDKIGNVYIWDINEYFQHNENQYYLAKQRENRKRCEIDM